MNLLIAASTFPRWADDEQSDFVWKQALAFKRRYPHLHITILAPHDRGSALEEEWEGIKIHRFRYFCPASLQKLVYPSILPNIQNKPILLLQIPLLLICELFATLFLIQKYKINLVYSHWFVPQGLACGIAAWIRGVPHVLTSHSSDITVMNKLPLLGRIIVRTMIGKAKAVTVVSQRGLSNLQSFFNEAQQQALEKKVKVIPMGVDEADFSTPSVETDSFKQELGLTGKRVLLFMGRLVEKKGIDLLIEAFLNINKEFKDTELVIAGAGHLEASLKRKVANLKLTDKVTFPGHVRGETKVRLLRAASLVAAPSVITSGGDLEGLPVVVLEALAAGKICVASEVSGAPEIITNDISGILFSSNDSEVLEKSLRKALLLSDDQQNQMSCHAKAVAQPFFWSNVIKGHYSHLLAFDSVEGEN
ncbi:glycosyltransferase [Oligoflexia bacterium]|nr:glycosyltransferase [Oligoflexia bacterium]